MFSNIIDNNKTNIEKLQETELQKLLFALSRYTITQTCSQCKFKPHIIIWPQHKIWLVVCDSPVFIFISRYPTQVVSH